MTMRNLSPSASGAASDVSDRTLWERWLRSRDAEALEELLARHQPAAMRLALSRLGNRTDAEDVLQSTWLKIISHPHQVRGDDLGPWLYVCVLNACRMHLREEGRRRLREIRAARSASSAEAEPVTDLHKNEGAAEPLDPRIQRAVAELPDQMREAIHLRYLAELTIPVMARVLGREEKAIRGALSSGLQRLRQQLRADGYEQGLWTLPLVLRRASDRLLADHQCPHLHPAIVRMAPSRALPRLWYATAMGLTAVVALLVADQAWPGRIQAGALLAGMHLQEGNRVWHVDHASPALATALNRPVSIAIRHRSLPEGIERLMLSLPADLRFHVILPVSILGQAPGAPLADVTWPVPASRVTATFAEILDAWSHQQGLSWIAQGDTVVMTRPLNDAEMRRWLAALSTPGSAGAPPSPLEPELVNKAAADPLALRAAILALPRTPSDAALLNPALRAALSIEPRKGTGDWVGADLAISALHDDALVAQALERWIHVAQPWPVAVRLAGELEVGSTGPAILALATQPGPARTEAIRALNARSEAQRTFLLSLLETGSNQDYIDAVVALARHPTPVSTAALCKIITDSSRLEQVSTALSAVAIDPDRLAQHTLRQVLVSRHDDLSWEALLSLRCHVGPEDIPMLGKMLLDEDETVRRTSCDLIGAMGGAETLPLLLSALHPKHDHEFVQTRFIMNGVQGIEPIVAHSIALCSDPAIVSLLAELLIHGPMDQARVAALALSDSCAVGAETVLQRTSSSDPQREALIHGARIACSDDATASAMFDHLERTDAAADVPLSTLPGSHPWSDDIRRRAIALALHARQPGLRAAMFTFLKEPYQYRPEVVAAAAQAIHDHSAHVRAAAVGCLIPVSAVLSVALHDPHPFVRASAIAAARQLVRVEAFEGDPDAKPDRDTLLQIVKTDPDPRVRQGALLVLTSCWVFISSAPRLDLCIELLHHDGDPTVRSMLVRYISRGLDILSGEDPDTDVHKYRDALISASEHDPSEGVRSLVDQAQAHAPGFHEILLPNWNGSSVSWNVSPYLEHSAQTLTEPIWTTADDAADAAASLGGNG